MIIALTVKQVGDLSLTPFEALFDTQWMKATKALGANDTTFFYPWDPELGQNGGMKKIVVNEAYATVKALAQASENGPGLVKEAWGLFDATGGKSVATHDIIDLATGQPMILPENSIILNGFANITTTFTSATDAATIALGVQTDSAAGLKAAIAISNGANPWDAGKTALIPVGTAATALGPITAGKKIQAVVAEEALTAGVMKLYLQYTVRP